MMPKRLAIALIALSAAAVVVLGAIGCASTRKQAVAATAAPPNREKTPTDFEDVKLDYDRDTDGAHPDDDELSKPPAPDHDGDSDSTAKTRFDSDDTVLVRFGHAAGMAETAQIVPLIRRYYAAAVAEDGAKACSLLYSTFAEAVPEDYGTSPPGPAYARGATCPAVLTAVFKHFHQEIAAKLPMLKVVVIRIRERQGVAVMSFGGASQRQVHIAREGHAWKVIALRDDELP